LTQPGLEPTIYRTRGEHANHYTPPMRWLIWYLIYSLLKYIGKTKDLTVVSVR
jgi:hypothetical protein